MVYELRASMVDNCSINQLFRGIKEGFYSSIGDGIFTIAGILLIYNHDFYLDKYSKLKIKLLI